MNGHDAWMKFAHEDLKVAKLVWKEQLYNQVCFHAQQCVEKSFKALLVHRGQVPPKTHRLATLISLVGSPKVQEFSSRVKLLDQIYIPTRYPDAIPGTLPEDVPNKAQAADALEMAQEIFELVMEVVS
mgnify:CR=1 FL=1|jgi:HEPN domain-containing protein